jgi:PST family polysaccharide transporter
MLRATFVDVALALAAILAGLRFGAVMVAATLAVTGVLVRLPVSFWLSTLRGPVRLKDLYATVLPSGLSGIAVAGAIAGLRHVLPHTLSPLIGLIVAAPLGLAVAATTFWIVPSSRRALASLLHLPKLMFGAEQPARG